MRIPRVPVSSSLQKWHDRSWGERWLLLEAVPWLGLSRLARLILPFNRLSPFLCQHMAESGQNLDATAMARAQSIGWAVRAVARLTPWESACLVQAMAAKRMLRRRGIPSTLYLGLARDESRELEAHASASMRSTFAHGQVRP